MHLSKPTVGNWRGRFVARLDGLLDEARPGAPRKIGDDAVERVLTLTLEKRPPDATHWSTRSMAKRSGWWNAGLRPCRKTDSAWDPPHHARVGRCHSPLH
jgi:hypothetical protein